MARIEIGDQFRHKGYAGHIYTARSEYQWGGKRRIVGYYQHAANQAVGIDMTEDEIVRVSGMVRADGTLV